MIHEIFKQKFMVTNSKKSFIRKRTTHNYITGKILLRRYQIRYFLHQILRFDNCGDMNFGDFYSDSKCHWLFIKKFYIYNFKLFSGVYVEIGNDNHNMNFTMFFH